MKHSLILLACIISLFSIQINAQTGCPGCQIQLDTMPEDTLFLGSPAAGEVNAFYDEDLSFRLPKTTTPVYAIDSTTIPNISISSFKILGLSNLPPGLSYEVNQTDFNPADQTDGCAKICGTPLASGQFFVTVDLEATVFGLTQPASFDFELIINPERDTSRLFQILDVMGCDELTTTFINNFPSNGNPGITYLWSFGNGETSVEENPGPVSFPWVGEFRANLIITIDTFPAQLSQISVISAECKDTRIPPILTGNPDLYFIIEELNGTEVFKSTNLENTDFPANFNVNLELEVRDYRLKVFDDDDILAGDDDLCGEVIFNPRQTVNLIDSVNNMEVMMTFFKPINRIFDTDTINIYASPPSPDITPDNSQVKCEGETTLSSSIGQNLQWFHDGNEISTDSAVGVNQAGNYWAVFTDPVSSCFSVSDTAVLAGVSFPSQPILSTDFDNLVCNGDIELTSSISDNIVWFFEGDSIANSAEVAINQAGAYVVHHTEPFTLCTTFSDTLRIGEIVYPTTPQISPDNIQVTCVDDLELTSSEMDNIVWFMDGSSLGSNPSIIANETGNYWIENTDPITGCSSVSDTVFVPEVVYPSIPEFGNDLNQLSLFPDVVLPANFTTQWFLNGDELVGETGTEYCMRESGLYTLVLTDLDTGCESIFEMDLTFDENADCTSSTSKVIDLQTIAKIFPNPNNGFFTIEMETDSPNEWKAELFSMNGKLVYKNQFQGIRGLISTAHLYAGIYVLTVTTTDGVFTSKVVKK